jgi:vancomycin resistance protein YoaR
MKNVYIDNLYVGELSYDNALSAIENDFMMEDSEITITSGGKVYSIYSNDIGMSALPEETVQKAMSYCKSGNVFKDGFNAVKLLFSKHVISPSAQVDTEKLDEKLNEFGNIVLGERKQHDVQIGDNNVAVIYPGTTGYDGNPESARNAVLAALKDSDFSGIKVTFTSAPPDELTLDAFDSLVYKEPANAEYYVENNQVSIIRGQVGRYIDKNEAEPLLAKVHEGGEAVEVPFYDSMPDLTSDMLRERLFNDTIGTYSTSFAGSTENRCANVARAASLINGTVIPPGEVFSFNNTVGHRTVENGFFTAKEYVDGKSVDGIGGGTCQVSSTLYSAVLYADLSIVTRTNHMMAVSYMPLGQDATVVDGSIDFKFKNNTDSPIKISTSISGTNLTVNIIGTQWTPKREVKLSHTSSQSGKNTVVKSVRNVYANGELIATDTLPSSSYAPHETE